MSTELWFFCGIVLTVAIVMVIYGISVILGTALESWSAKARRRRRFYEHGNIYSLKDFKRDR